jgi:hypothetical protein
MLLLLPPLLVPFDGRIPNLLAQKPSPCHCSRPVVD